MIEELTIYVMYKTFEVKVNGANKIIIKNKLMTKPDTNQDKMIVKVINNINGCDFIYKIIFHCYTQRATENIGC